MARRVCGIGIGRYELRGRTRQSARIRWPCQALRVIVTRMETIVTTPKILYFGTPVVLISTLNPDGSANLMPMSSAWWLDQSCMLGLGTSSMTHENLLRERECVLNLPTDDMAGIVDRLALTTARNPVPEYKARTGSRYIARKFEHAGVTPVASELVTPPRVAECPVQLEATVTRSGQFGDDDDHDGFVEVKIRRAHISPDLLMAHSNRHIDPDKWRPLIMNFCEFYGLTGKVHGSRLGRVFPYQDALTPEIVASVSQIESQK
jgi:flavin reductase (DIM6/NTAB) family NADH-FMN oxidoreductase RutF